MVRWTLVARNPRGKFFRPVAGAPVDTWETAHDVGAVLGSVVPNDVDIWWVPAQGESTHEEDRDNILVDSGRRIPIRWDAEPQYTVVQGPCPKKWAWAAGAVEGP